MTGMKRKSLSSGPRGSTQSVERRTKARNDVPTASQLEEASEQPSVGSNPEWCLFASRKVYPGRRIDFKFLEDEGFNFGLKIKELGWEHLCSLNVPTYPELVKEFYCCLTVKENVVESIVKGIKITMNDYLLGTILKTGAFGDDREGLTEEERREAVETICGYAEEGEIKAKLLSAELRLLFHISGRLFLPKTGGFDRVTQQDLMLVWNILNGHSVNLPALMMRRMLELRNRKGGCLPYGMFLTEIFNHFQVNLQGETSKKPLWFDVYNEDSLHRMNFHKVGNEWKSKERTEEAAFQTAGPSTSMQHETPAPVPQEAASAPPIAPAVTTLSEEQMSYIINSVVGQLLPEIKLVHRRLDQMHENLESRIRLINDKVSKVSGTCWNTTRRMDELEKMASASIRRQEGIQADLKSIVEGIAAQSKKIAVMIPILGGLKDLSYLVFRQIELHCQAGYANTKSAFDVFKHLLGWLKKSGEEPSPVLEHRLNHLTCGNIEGLQNHIGISAAQYARPYSSRSTQAPPTTAPPTHTQPSTVQPPTTQTPKPPTTQPPA